MAAAPESPLLVLFPGLDGHGPFFQTLLEHLPPAFETLVLSYPPVPLGYEALAEHVLAQIDAERPIVLVGKSYGGPLAILLAASGRLRARGLILLATFCEPPLPVWLLNAIRAAYPWLIRQAFAPKLLNFFFINGRNLPLAEEATAVLRAQPDEVIQQRFASLASCHLRKTLAALSLPTLALIAGHDRVVWRHYPRSVLHRPGFDSATLATPHVMADAMPRQMAEEIVEFLKKLD